MNFSKYIERDPEKMSGAPVFTGTRVLIQNLFDCLESGETVDDFLDQFPTVKREQALDVLAASRRTLLEEYEVVA